MTKVDYQRLCKDCELTAIYRIANTQFGPRPTWSLHGKGLYCLPHAKERADVLMVAYKERYAAKVVASRQAHAEWLAARDSA